MVFYLKKTTKIDSITAAKKNKGKTMEKNIFKLKIISFLGEIFLNKKLNIEVPKRNPMDRAINIAGISKMPCGINEKRTNAILVFSTATLTTTPITKELASKIKKLGSPKITPLR